MAITTETISYVDGQIALTGHLFHDPGATGPRPGVLLVHGGGGLDAHALGQGKRYAELGYVVFACDMFSAGVERAREESMALLMELRSDPVKLAQRAAAGLTELQKLPQVTDQIAAVGFCFGGTTVLTLAREGAGLLGVISMHGAVTTSKPAQPDVVTAKVLVCHGAADPHVPMEDVSAFVEEMERAGVDSQVVIFSGAVHGFTHSDAVPGAFPGVEYDEATDRRSFKMASDFLAEIFR